MSLSKFQPAEILVLDGGAIPLAPVMPASTGIRLKRVQEHNSAVNVRKEQTLIAGASTHGCLPACGGRMRSAHVLRVASMTARGLAARRDKFVPTYVGLIKVPTYVGL